MPQRSTDVPDPVPPAVRDVLALFAAELHDTRFGDLDAASLEELAERTRERASEVERARAALDAAHLALDEARDALARRADQALQYAKVYAANDEALSARLAGLEGAVAEPPKRVKRQRAAAPKKASAPSATELPFEARTNAA